MRFLISLVIVLFCLATPVSAAQSGAEGTPEGERDPDTTVWFVIVPEGRNNGDYFDIVLDAGESATLTGRFGNGSAIPVQAILYAADVVPNINGGFALADSTATVSGPTTWLDFPSITIDFEASQAIDRSFTVSVPEDTPPGQYITGVAVETAESTVVPGGSMILVNYRLATPVLITVPGEVVPGFDVSDLSVEVDDFSTTLTGTITNTGNIRVRPTGNVVLTNASGQEVVDGSVDMGSVYMDQTTIFSITITSPIPEGTYAGSVTLVDPDTGATASLEVPKVEVAAPEAPAPIQITSATITPMPSADNLVFAQVSATITNTAMPVSGVELGLTVFLDGEEVDSVSLGSSITIQPGETSVSQPYIPASGTWDSGEYSFELTLTSTDPQSGSKTLIATVSLEETIEIP